MSENSDVIEKIILGIYIAMLEKDTMLPSVNNIVRECKLKCEKEAYDLIYGDDFITKIDEQVVHDTLARYKHAHRYSGSTCYEAQNLLFSEWYDYQLLLKE
jgi:hypothetical protein